MHPSDLSLHLKVVQARPAQARILFKISCPCAAAQAIPTVHCDRAPGSERTRSKIELGRLGRLSPQQQQRPLAAESGFAAGWQVQRGPSNSRPGTDL